MLRILLHDAFEDLQVLMLEMRPRLVLAVAGRWVPAGATTGGPAGGDNRLDAAAETSSHERK
jgi:hypothetical protein